MNAVLFQFDIFTMNQDYWGDQELKSRFNPDIASICFFQICFGHNFFWWILVSFCFDCSCYILIFIFFLSDLFGLLMQVLLLL